MDKKKNVPVLSGVKNREKSIKNDTPSVFNILGNNSHDLDMGVIDDVYNIDYIGKKSVQKYNDKILKSAERHNVDPDIIRAIMFVENARGHKLGLNYIADVIKKSDSIMPMNIQKDRWSSLIGKRPDEMYDEDNNIEASTVLIKRIRDRIPNATPEKIGTLWQNSADNEVSKYGKYVGDVYRKKPWAIIE